MRFRRQLIIVHVASIVVTMLTLVVAIVALESATSSGDRIATDLATDVSVADLLRLDAERLVTTSRGYLLTGEVEYKQHFQSVETELYSVLARMSSLHGANETLDIERDMRTYIAAVKRADDHRELPAEPNTIVEIFDRDLKPARARFELDVDRFVDHDQARFAAATKQLRSRTRRAQLAVVVTSMIALALSAAISTLFIRALTRQMRRLEAATDRANRISASREELVAVVSHDLRNPLQSIVLNASLLKVSCLDGASHRHVASIQQAGEQMSRLIDDLFDAVRVERGEILLHREHCEIEELLRAAIEPLQRDARDREIALRCDAPASLTVDADRGRILQVFSNLIGNAIKFAGSDAVVTVTAVAEAHEIRFIVADTGPGIPRDVLPHVFDRYYQADQANRGGGLGLGLYICRRLVEAHHGRIGVDTELGIGSAFWFTLPTEPTSLS